MDLSTVIKELSRIKHNCSCITFKECLTGNCPYHGKRYPIARDEYDADTGEVISNTHSCLFEDIGMSMPCDWEIPEEI